VKLLLDQNISRRLVSQLVKHFPGSSQVALLGLERATDLEIWEYAKKNDYTIVTKDSDFEELSLIRKSPPKVILIRSGNTSNKNTLQVLLDEHNEVEELLMKTEINCLEIY